MHLQVLNVQLTDGAITLENLCDPYQKFWRCDQVLISCG